jgi:hypothetical protein
MQRSAISKEIATIIRCLIFLLLASAASATDITELIRAAKHQSDIQDSELAYAALFPKIDGVERYEKYNSPINLRPLPALAEVTSDVSSDSRLEIHPNRDQRAPTKALLVLAPVRED